MIMMLILLSLASNLSVRCWPIKPAPPVMSQLFIIFYPILGLMYPIIAISQAYHESQCIQAYHESFTVDRWLNRYILADGS